MTLDPSESINNMGNLRVDLLDAAELPSADRNGKSDPYAKFELNGQEIFKSKVIKKTLAPAWNEYFEVAVPSRTGANFKVDIYDYDFADKPDFLGSADINLAILDPFKASETKYTLNGKSGTVRLRLLFKPDYVTRTRQGTSAFGTFGGPTRIVTGVAGAPIKGGVAVAGAVGHGVGKSASFLKRGLMGGKKRQVSMNGSTSDLSGLPEATVTDTDGGLTKVDVDTLDDRPPTSNGGFGHSRTKSFGASSVHSATPSAAPGGSGTLTIVGASGFPPSADLYISVRQISPKEKSVGKTKHQKSSTGQWNFGETFKIAGSADAQYKIEAKGNHSFGKDDDFGDHIYFVDDSGSGATKDITVGSGTVTLKSNFQSVESSLGTESPRASMRRSFLSKRDPRSSRESTPVS